jgi:DNA-binding protein WhiA
MSFSSETKTKLAEKAPGKDCCKHAMLAGMFRFSTFADENTCVFQTETIEVSEAYARLFLEIAGVTVQTKKVGTIYKNTLSGEDFKIVADIVNSYGENLKDVFTCPKCDDHFFRGAFLVAGFVNPPEKPRVELSTASADLACDTATALTLHFRLPKLSVRRGNQIIYFRDAESVHYFLSYIGAKKESFEVINAKMLREKNNEVNRKQNFDMANLTKTVNAAGIYVDAIQALMASGDFEKLPAELRTTAKNRVENDTLTLQELANMENPPISKSQVSKRLQKIYHFYEEIQQNSTK